MIFAYIIIVISINIIGIVLYNFFPIYFMFMLRILIIDFFVCVLLLLLLLLLQT